jgi:hypothetical protein
MPWGAAAGAVIGLAGDAMKDDKNGGAGTTTSSSEPWMPATPWLLQNLQSGQALQQQYADRPFSARQLAAYDQSYAQGDAMRSLVPSLLGQLQGQPVGFDKNNRSARPKAWDWDSFIKSLGEGGSVRNAQEPAAAPVVKESPGFTQQDMGYTALQQSLLDSGRNPFMTGYGVAIGGQPGGSGVTGGFGSYRYGDTPKPGTQAYRDMTEYFLMGGNDPWDLAPAGMGLKRAANPFLLGGGTTTGDSVGGSAAADGSGGGGPGAF